MTLEIIMQVQLDPYSRMIDMTFADIKNEDTIIVLYQKLPPADEAMAATKLNDSGQRIVAIRVREGVNERIILEKVFEKELYHIRWFKWIWNILLIEESDGKDQESHTFSEYQVKGNFYFEFVEKFAPVDIQAPIKLEACAIHDNLMAFEDSQKKQLIFMKTPFMKNK